MMPKDPVILLSFVNTKLRDEFPSLSELCAALDADEAAGGSGGAELRIRRRTKPVCLKEAH